jgi:hypothetical protein
MRLPFGLPPFSRPQTPEHPHDARMEEIAPKNGRPDYDNDFPWFGDFDGDGRPDLLVGQHTYHTEPGKKQEGRLRIYKNIGEKGRPRFGDPLWFDDLVPTGRIPAG